MQPTPGQERRGAPRRKQHRVRVQVRGPRGERGKPCVGWVVDRSRSGLCLLLDQEVKVGTTLELRPLSAPAKMSWIQVVVKNRRRRDQGIVLGCKFSETPALVPLLLFG